MGIFGIFLAILMFGVWTSCFAIGKLTLAHTPPIFLTAIRMLCGGLLITSYLFFFKRKELFSISKKQFLQIIFLSIFSIYLTNVLEFWGLQYLSAAKTCFIYSLSPIFAALLSYIHFKEKLNSKKIIGLTIGLLGFIPTLSTQTGTENSTSSLLGFSYPEIALSMAALFSVYGWVILRLFVKEDKTEINADGKGSSLSPLTANGLSMCIGGFMALGHSLVVEPWDPLPIKSVDFSSFLVGISYMIVISNVLCYNLYGYLLKRYTATLLSFLGLFSPIFASITGFIILNEKPSPMILLSTFIVIIGFWVFYQSELKQGYVQPDTKDAASS